jgi:polyribonucleotide nucleotidyltransferase
MDFKVTGTSVELQLVKWISRLTVWNMRLWAALAQARDGRLHILGKLIETLAAPRRC